MKNDNGGVVYLITCEITGKHYIGITSARIQSRWSNHKARAKAGWPGKLYNAVRKYGSNAFTLCEIGRADSWKELQALERVKIKEFNTLKNGYNLTEGGEGNLGWSPSAAWRKKLSESNKGRKYTPEQIAALSARVSGRGNPMFGKTHSRNTRDKISKALTGHTGLIAPRRLSVEQKNKISRRLRDRAKRFKFKESNLTLREWSEKTNLPLAALKKRISTYKMLIGTAVTKPLNACKIGFQITWDGVSKNKNQWARHLGLSNKAFQKRLGKWGLEKTMTTKRIDTRKFLTFKGRKLQRSKWAKLLNISHSLFNWRLKNWGLKQTMTTS